MQCMCAQAMGVEHILSHCFVSGNISYFMFMMRLVQAVVRRHHLIVHAQKENGAAAQLD